MLNLKLRFHEIGEIIRVGASMPIYDMKRQRFLAVPLVDFRPLRPRCEALDGKWKVHQLRQGDKIPAFFVVRIHSMARLGQP